MSHEKQKKRSLALRCGAMVRSGPKLSEERIATISNDISEGIYDTHTKAELRECVVYFRQRAFEAESARQAELSALLTYALERHNLQSTRATSNISYQPTPGNGAAKQGEHPNGK